MPHAIISYISHGCEIMYTKCMQKQADSLAELFVLIGFKAHACFYGFNLTRVNISCNCNGRYPLDATDFDVMWQSLVRLCHSLEVKFQLARGRNGVTIAVDLRLCELCMKMTMAQDDTCTLWPHFHRGFHNLIMKWAVFRNCYACGQRFAIV